MLDFEHAVSVPFRMQPGLRRLPSGTPHLTPALPESRTLLAKARVLQSADADALLCAPGFEAEPALAALAQLAEREHPQAWQAGAQSACSAPLLRTRLNAAQQAEGEHAALLNALPAPWRRTALLCLAFEEDFAIVDGAAASVPWMAVCLPSHWAPRDKVGLDFHAIHAPVADNALLQAAGPRLMKLVTQGEPWERFVWTIRSDGPLDAHPQRHRPTPWPVSASAAELAQGAWLRSEHQTFVALPTLGQAVFTIHVETRPLPEAITTAVQAQRLAQSLASMSDAVLAYRALAPARDRLVAWLQEQALHLHTP